MQPAFSTPFPEPLLAAKPQLSEKLRLGVQSWNPAWYPGFNVCNSTAVLGLQFRCSEIVSGPVVAPNNGTKQPTSPVVKLICQQQAKGVQAKYNAAATSDHQGNVLGTASGVGLFGMMLKQAFGGIALGTWWGLKMNSAESNTVYEIAYGQCISGNYN
jgi:hypothetical protein